MQLVASHLVLGDSLKGYDRQLTATLQDADENVTKLGHETTTEQRNSAGDRDVAMDSIPAIGCVNGKETVQKNVDTDIDTRSCQPFLRLQGFWVLRHVFDPSISMSYLFSSGLGHVGFAGLDFKEIQGHLSSSKLQSAHINKSISSRDYLREFSSLPRQTIRRFSLTAAQNLKPRFN